MSRQRKKSDREKQTDESGFGASLATGAAVVGVAALAYGAWKLYDFFTSESEASGAAAAGGASPSGSAANKNPGKKCCDSSDDDDDVTLPTSSRRAAGSRNRSEETDSSSRAAGSWNHSEASRMTRSLTGGALPLPQAPLVEKPSLSAQLLDYYRTYVDVSPLEVKEAMKVVKEVKMQVACGLQRNKKLKMLGVGDELVETGSYSDGMMVIRPESFDILIPFYINRKKCGVRPSPEKECLSLVLRTAEETRWLDVCVGSKYLDPAGFMNALESTIREAVDNCNTTIEGLTVIETSAIAEGCYIACGIRRKLIINFVPAVFIGKRRFIPGQQFRRTTCGDDVDDAFHLASWRESFALQELEIVRNKFGPEVSGHKIILKIFKAIRLNFAQQFGVLSSYHYKMVWYRILDDLADADDWLLETISERFIDFLIELGNCLKEHKLPHHFNSKWNLLDDISPESLQTLTQFINKILGHHDVGSLLKRDYGE